MRKGKAFWLPLSILAVIVLCTNVSHATQYWFDGQMCRSAAGSGYAASDAFHIKQNILQFSTAYCRTGGFTTDEIDVTSAEVVITDSDTAGDIRCQLVGWNWDGSLLVSVLKHSCPTYGGCADFYPNWIGRGELRWTDPLKDGKLLYPQSLTFVCEIWGTATIHGYNVTF